MVYGKMQADIRLLSSLYKNEGSSSTAKSSSKETGQEISTITQTQERLKSADDTNNVTTKQEFITAEPGFKDCGQKESSRSFSESDTNKAHLGKRRSVEEVDHDEISTAESQNVLDKDETFEPHVDNVSKSRTLSCASAESNDLKSFDAETEQSFVTLNNESESQTGLPPPATYISKYRQSDEPDVSPQQQEPLLFSPKLSRKYTPVPTQFVEDLSPDEQYILRVAHGWDSAKKGGGIQVYPNIPEVCLPNTLFAGKVQVKV